MFTIPNLPDASRASQSEPDSGDFRILADGIGGNGVESGCAVTSTGAANGSVLVAAGQVLVNDIYAAVASGTLGIGSNSSGNPRFDLIAVDASGTKSVIAGTPAAVPVFPTIPDPRVVLAAVYVPNGHTAGSTTIPAGDLVDKRVFRSASDFNSHNVLKYGAIGNSHHLTGGGADDTAAFQAAYDAAQAPGGYGIVMVPGGRSYRVTSTIDICPDPSKVPVWTWGVGGFGGNQVIALPNIVWDGATDGIVMSGQVSGQNLPGALFRNVRVTCRDIAANCVRLGPSSTNPAKLDTGTGFDEVHLVDARSHALLSESSGATNFWIRGGRFDAIGGYAISMLATSGIHLSIRDVTWDPNGPPAGTTPKGFLELNGAAMEADAYMMVHLDNVHTEVQVDLAVTDAAGLNPADQRGVYAFTINPSNQRTQFVIVGDNIRTTGWATTRASHSVFQMLGGTLVQRTARICLNIRGMRPTFGSGANSTGHCIPLGNVTNAKQPHVVAAAAAGGQIPGNWGKIEYGPGGDNLFGDEKPGWVEVYT